MCRNIAEFMRCQELIVTIPITVIINTKENRARLSPFLAQFVTRQSTNISSPSSQTKLPVVHVLPDFKSGKQTFFRIFETIIRFSF